jgi:hypothetical protein
MAKLTVNGREFDIAPYNFADMIKAAPIIDQINATVSSLSSMSDLYRSAVDIIQVLAIGVAKIDPAVTADEIVAGLPGSAEALRDLQTVFSTLLRESGLQSGEVTAPTAPEIEPAGASSTNSDTSSAS